MSFFDKFLGNAKKQDAPPPMRLQWQLLDDESLLQHIIQESSEKPMVIFKHSTRCSISAMAKRRLERNWDIASDFLDIYYLDLIRYRSISNLIATTLEVQHESPQLILLKGGTVVFHTSHNSISVESLKAEL